MKKIQTSWMMIFLVLFLLGCGSPAPENIPASSAEPPKEVVTTAPAVAPEEACTTKECFISAANNCENINITITEDIGVIAYSAKRCVFTKKMVSVNESQEIKKLLEGKELTCRYMKEAFDERWVTSLIFGTEYCEGELKDILGKLIVFT